MNFRWLVWLLAVAISAALIGLICCGSLWSFFLVACAFGAWVLTGVVLTFAVFFSKDSNTAPKWQEPWVRFLVAASVAIVGGVYFGGHVHEWQAGKARAFVAEMVPKLDQYFREHGEFPDDLSPFGAFVTPSVAWQPLRYSGGGSWFTFEYPDRWGFLDDWQYDSEARRWRLS